MPENKGILKKFLNIEVLSKLLFFF
ncbi:hypothetical protein NITGR_920009 [Nitrospina gracilis 3/211]|uniref:Uncharacterized protein n=1 Tax=Nitrospina gracilis (strain 3/211) TaxID=1266370 RepID=M1YNE0_NITG3|nr:hypothetical protein NITGR_920009 [Nitrospina gracilis 3/211]